MLTWIGKPLCPPLSLYWFSLRGVGWHVDRAIHAKARGLPVAQWMLDVCAGCADLSCRFAGGRFTCCPDRAKPAPVDVVRCAVQVRCDLISGCEVRN